MNAVSVIKDINGFFSYLKSDCTSKEFLYITDWFDELVDQKISQELIDAFRETMKTRFLEETHKEHIEKDLEEAIKYYGNGFLR